MRSSLVEYCKSSPGRRTALILAGVMSVLFLVVRHNMIEVARGDVERQLRHVLDSVEADTRALLAEKSATAQFLAELSPVQGIVGTGKNLDFDDWGKRSYRDWQARLSQIFIACLRSNLDIVNARYVGIAHEGRELVHVERRDGTIRVIPSESLESRMDLSPFRDAIELPPRGIFVSSLNARPADPTRNDVVPTLSFSTPIYDENDRIFGLVILNVDVRPFLTRLAEKDREIGILGLNPQGEVFLSPDTEAFPPPGGDWNDDLAHLRFDLGATPMFQLPSRDGDTYLVLTKKLPHSRGDEHALAFATMVPLSTAVAREQVHTMRLGAVMGLLSVIIFLTGAFRWSRTRQRLELQRRQARLGALISGSRDAIVQMRRGREVVGWNAAAENLFGFSASEIIGRDLVPTLGLSSADPRTKPSPDFVQSGKWELKARSKNGKALEVIASVSGKADQLEPSEETAVIFRDVTEERATEESIKSLNRGLEEFAQETSAELAETAAFKDAILRNAGTAIIATDAHWTITAANPAALRMLGYSAAEMIGVMTPLKYLDPEELAQKAAALEEELARPVIPPAAQFIIQVDRLGVFEDDYTYIRKDGSRLPVRLTLTRIVGARGETAGYLGLAADRTVALQRELAMERAWEEAERANRAKSRFVANVSHEIRTPMNAIWGMLQLLDASQMTRLQHRQVTQARAAAEVLLSIINDVLDLSKIEAGKLDLVPVSFRLHTILEHLANMTNSTLGDKDVDIFFSVQGAVPDRLVGDSLRLQQILVNLLSNAVKFTERGYIGLSVALQEQSKHKVSISFEVTDTGIGMAPSQLRKVFQDFVQAESSTTHRYGGTGLGLSISKQLVELMGGRLRADSRLNEGTTFSFSVPLSIANRESGLSLCKRNARGLRVLIVEKNAHLHAIWKGLLEPDGWQTQFTSSTDLARIRLVREQFDVLLLDLRLATGRFLETARALAGPEMTILLVAQSLASQIGDLEGLCDDVIMKPLTATKLQEAVMPLRRSESEILADARKKPLAGLSLLVVDDITINLEVAGAFLSAAGASVRAARDGFEAIEAVKSGSRFDAILMDIQMPELNGIETTERLRELPLAVPPIIAFTAGVATSEREACLRVGMADFITKPFRIETVLSVLQKHIPQARFTAEPTRDPPALSEEHPRGFFHYADAVRCCGENHEVLVAEIRRFCRDSAAVGKAIEELVAAGRMSVASQACHGLKGISGMLGARRLSAKAGEFEVALLSDKSCDDLLPISKELSWCVARTIEHMGNHLEMEGVYAEPLKIPRRG